MFSYDFITSLIPSGFKRHRVSDLIISVENFLIYLQHHQYPAYTLISIFIFLQISNETQSKVIMAETLQSPPTPSSGSKYRTLYHNLQNPASHTQSLKLQALQTLHRLFDITISKTLSSQTSPTILTAVPQYSPANLIEFLTATERATTARWEEYISRRTNDQDREFLITPPQATHLLRLSAPVKCVDGVWLSGLHRANTPLRFRPVTRTAWQTFSEELGDGHLDRNHVYIYSQLLKSLQHPAKDIGDGDSTTFIEGVQSPSGERRDISTWIAGIAQLSLGMFPELLPEILGFNLAYEAVTFETLISAYEARELKLDPMYFNLHVTIDNSDSGHTAMALHAVTEFMRRFQAGSEEEREMWKRVQVGYVLATELPIHPRPWTKTEDEVLEIFTNKCRAALPAHLRCKAHIGGSKGMKLGEWMDVEGWEDRKYSFLEALGASAWVVPGKAEESKLVQEISWKGRMFGAFTVNETAVLKRWISEMSPLSAVEELERDMERAKGAYINLVGSSLEDLRTDGIDPAHHSTIEMVLEACLLPRVSSPGLPEIPSELPMDVVPKNFNPCKLLVACAMPLEHYLSSPTKSATERGTLVLGILRILNGFPKIAGAIAGMDEVIAPSGIGAVELAHQLHIFQAHTQPMELDLGSEWDWFKSTSRSPESNFYFLLGVQYAFVFLMHSPEAFGVFDGYFSSIMQDMSINIEDELDEFNFRGSEESKRGFWMTINTVIREG
ncbi:hypothetical protein TWF481_003800 [Arthrobotrys musiformis]|uniref:Uncharacterized protein n=1 Tax=Arthrobotrys musiformis TaxID=47236 RepID=A0AAV9WJP4_9PEZI